MTGSTAKGFDTGSLTVAHRQIDGAKWRFYWTVEKFSEQHMRELAAKLGCSFVDVSSAMMRKADIRPYETLGIPGNLLVNDGIQLILDKLIGGSGTVASNANAQLGVGSDNTAAAASQSDLQDASAVWQGMNASYPQRTNQTMDWQADFGSGSAEFAWEEWGVRNDSSAAVLINRKVESLGTKSSGTWTLTGSVEIS